MNPLNNLENTLKSWTPRHPSTRVRDAVFGSRPTAPSQPDRSRRDWSPWAAPAMACALFLLAAPQLRFDADLRLFREVAPSQNPHGMHSGLPYGQSMFGSIVEQNAPPSPRIERLLAMDVREDHASAVYQATNHNRRQ